MDFFDRHLGQNFKFPSPKRERPLFDPLKREIARWLTNVRGRWGSNAPVTPRPKRRWPKEENGPEKPEPKRRKRRRPKAQPASRRTGAG